MKRRNSGYTLIELLVVISIVAILLGMIAVCAVGGYFVYRGYEEAAPIVEPHVEEAQLDAEEKRQENERRRDELEADEEGR